MAYDANFEFFRANGNRLADEQGNICSTRQNLAAQSWSPPDVGTIKINVDASFDANSCRAASAVIVRDDKGVMLIGSSISYPSCCPIVAEAVVVREAMIFVVALDKCPIVVESDCAEVVNACTSSTIP